MRMAAIRVDDIVQTQEGEYVLVVERHATAQALLRGGIVSGYVCNRPSRQVTLKAREIVARWSKRAS